MRDQKLHSALNTKITRERIKIEVMKMTQSRHPQMAFELLHRTRLYATVFLQRESPSYFTPHTVLPNTAAYDRWPVIWSNAYRKINYLSKISPMMGKYIKHPRASPDDDNVWILAALAPIPNLGKPLKYQGIVLAGEAMRLSHGTSKILDASMKNLRSNKPTTGTC